MNKVSTYLLPVIAYLIFFFPTVIHAETILQYDWQDGCQYECEFQLGLSVAGTKLRFNGSTTYTPQPKEKKDLLDSMLDDVEQESKESTGTGFLIDSKGTMVTCAHVIRGATEIKAIFGKNSYEAKVISYDSEHDLALLKIKANNLPHLPVVDSKHVALGQDIRVIGYPLTDVLGSSIKISRGTISGINQQEGAQQRFQIDARVNPGNSGGPLVDGQGRVVGVASELLTADRIDSVGFAIPSNQILAMLKKNNIEPDSLADGPELKGTELAKRVTPSVALLKVQTSKDGVGMHKAKQLQYMAHLFKQNSTHFSGPNNTHESGITLVDSRGEILSTESKEPVPAMFQLLGEVGIERLPGDARRKWSYSHIIMLETLETKQADPGRGRPYPFSTPRYPRLRSPMSPYRRYPHRHNQPSIVVSKKTIPVREEASYQIQSESKDETITISKKYSFHTLNKNDDEADSIDLKLEGTFVWDKHISYVKESRMKGKLLIGNDGVTVRVPIAFTYTGSKETREQAQKRQAQQAEKIAKFRKEHEERRRKREAEKAKTDSSRRTPGRPSVPMSQGLKKFNPDD